MARPSFTIEGIANTGPVAVTLTSISKEVALNLGRKALTEQHGKVRNVTVRYTASDFRSTAADFVDENRSDDD